MRAATTVGAVLVATVLAAAPARAHDETVSTSDVHVSERLLIWRVDLGVAGLGKIVRFPAAEPDLTESDLAQVKDVIAATARRGLTVEINGQRTEPEVGALEPRYEPFIASGRPYIARVVLELRYKSERPIERARARIGFFSDLTAQHRAVVTVRSATQARQYVRLGVADLDLDPAAQPPGVWARIREFLLWGAEHIFIGYDHIAFLLALLLVAGGWVELLKIVTSFTAAHSLTLVLAALDVVRVPSRITEALIAASIVYVAAENLWRARPGPASRSMAYRWRLTFLFGLVHGLGFATALRDRLAELGGSILVPVLSFNLGVELGQVVIVSVVFPLVLLARRTADAVVRARRELRLVRFGSVPILLLGLGWLVERLAL